MAFFAAHSLSWLHGLGGDLVAQYTACALVALCVMHAAQGVEDRWVPWQHEYTACTNGLQPEGAQFGGVYFAFLHFPLSVLHAYRLDLGEFNSLRLPGHVL